MLIKRGEAARAMARPDPSIRLFILGGPDESGSRALLASFAAGLGPEAEAVDLPPGRLRDDPALLADEAASISLFGGRRWIRINVLQGSGDDVVTAAETLLNASVAGNPAVVTGSGITNRSKLFRLAETHPLAGAILSYLPEGAEADRLADQLASRHGLTLAREVARAIAEACGGDRGLMEQEIGKLALYLDADPDRPQRASPDDWQAIGAELREEDVSGAINVVLGGQVADLPATLALLEAMGTSDIRLVRGLATRTLLLARLRVAVEAGQSPRQVVDAQGKAIFFKEKADITRQLGLWDVPAIADLISRLHGLERQLKAPKSAGMLLLRAALTDIARRAAAARGYS